MTTTTATAQTICQTIIDQIGRGAFAMLGARNLIDVGNGLQFDIQGSRKVNRIRVILDPTDTYTVEFYKMTKTTFRPNGTFKMGTATKVAEESDVYGDSICRVITSVTGLYTSL